MEEATDIKTVWFTNMLLLGLDPVSLERKLRIPFNKDMFTLPNKKGFEVVMYFLFDKLNPLQTKEEFRYCYPASDKKQETQFRKVCNDWLTRLSKEEPATNLPRIVASVFLSPGGDKFYELLFAFSTYILTKQTVNSYGFKSRNVLKRPFLSAQAPDLGPVLQSAIKSATVRHRERFLGKCESVVDVQKDWKEYASREVKKYRSLNRTIKDIEKKVKVEMEITAEKGAARGSPLTSRRRSGLQDYNFDVQSVKRAQRVQKVRDLWKAVDVFYEERAEEREIVTSVIEGTMEKYKIDSNEFDVKIPDMLLRECEKEIHRRSVGNIYHGGKLNLHSLLQLWNLSLHLYIEKLHHVGVTSFEDAAPTVTTQLHTHQAHLNNAQTLRSKLSKEMLPVLKQSVDMLKKRLDANIFHAKSPGTIRTTVSSTRKSLGLNLLPTTPPVTFTPADLGHSPVHDTQYLTRNNDHVSTPEAASQLIDVITDKVKGKHASSLAHGIPMYTWRQQQNLLPTDNYVEVERVGQKQRTRIKSAPANTMSSTFTNSPLGSLHDAKQEVKGRRARKSLATSTQEPSKFTGGKNVKITSSGTQLVEVDREQMMGAKQTMTEQTVRQKSAITNDQDVFKIPVSAAKKSAINGHKFAPKIEKHYNQRVSFLQKPQAQDILADKIVDSMLSEENNAPDLTDSLTIGQEAFVSKDKLSRTPETQPRVPAYPADYNSLLNESLTHMPSPLSSTRIEAVAVDREEAQDLATRLFTENSDGEDEIVTAGPDISPTPPSTRNLSNNNCASKTSLSGPTVSEENLDRGNINPSSSLQRLEGDGGPAFKMSSDGKDDDESNSSDTNVLNLGNLEEALKEEADLTERRMLHLSREILDHIDEADIPDKNMLTTTEALYEELNQSRTPELPSKRHRHVANTSVGNTSVQPSVKSPASMSLSPNRSPKMDELHKSLDHFEELVHNIQEATINVSARSQGSMRDNDEAGLPIGQTVSQPLVGSSVLEKPSQDTVGLDNVCFPGDVDTGDDLANLSARVIELQNGTFTEFMELSPDKKKVSNEVGHSISFSLTMQNDIGHREPDMLSHTLPNITSIDRETLGSLDKETESIIERYKKLRLASTSLNDNRSNNAQEFSNEGEDNRKQSPAGSSPLNEKYLQETPNKIKVRRSKKVSLAFDSQSDLSVQSEPTGVETSFREDDVFKRPRTPPKSSKGNDGDRLIHLSPFSTPTRRSFQEGVSYGSPMFGLHSVPLSPTTDALHKEMLTPRTRKRRSMFESILDEDESVLLPSSPPTGNLLDI